MIRLLDYPQAIVAAKSENWKYLLFAQELFEDVDRSPSERQIPSTPLASISGESPASTSTRPSPPRLESALLLQKEQEVYQEGKRVPCEDER